jgi:hypothetical protein
MWKNNSPFGAEDISLSLFIPTKIYDNDKFVYLHYAFFHSGGGFSTFLGCGGRKKLKSFPFSSMTGEGGERECGSTDKLLPVAFLRMLYAPFTQHRIHDIQESFFFLFGRKKKKFFLLFFSALPRVGENKIYNL